MNLENILVLYHHPCTDGYVANIIAHLFYKRNPKEGRNVTFVGVNPSILQSDLEKCLQGKRFSSIRMFDVSVGPEHYKQLCSASDDVLVFDHHESTIKQCAGVDTTNWLTFNNSKCGAHLAWIYYFGDALLPNLVKYVQVRDLWLFGKERDILNSKEITTFLYETLFSLPFQPEETYFHLFEMTKEEEIAFWDNACQKGAEMLKKVDEQVDFILKDAKFKTITLPNEKKLVAAIVQSDKFVSEVGNKVATSFSNADFALIWTFDEENRIRISLRSNAQRCNVNDVARSLWGGGGHAAASGALISKEEGKEAFSKLIE